MGVYFRPACTLHPWKAYVKKNGRNVFLGYHATRDEAELACRVARRISPKAKGGPVGMTAAKKELIYATYLQVRSSYKTAKLFRVNPSTVQRIARTKGGVRFYRGKGLRRHAVQHAS